MSKLAMLVVIALLGLVAPVQAQPAPPAPPTAPPDALDQYTAVIAPSQVQQLRADGFDLQSQGREGPNLRVDLVLSEEERAKLAGRGIAVELARTETGATAREFAAQQAAGGYEVFRSYSQPGGIEDELRAIARDNPGLVKLVTVGQSLRGQPILALKVTKNARTVPDNTRPAVLYSSLQHAREWITVEVNRRLLRSYVDGYGRDPRVTRLLDTRELWFLVVANPDGYDYTFSTERLWRKNLRDNNGDGRIATPDGVDLNRNFPYKWGYDNEGSAANPSDGTFRGAGPASEPETRAMLGLHDRVDFEFQLNYHSFGPLLLYGLGWQVTTETADDVVYEALSGTDERPAIPGFDPGQSADLYTTNGDTDSHMHAVNKTLTWTPELSEGCNGCGFVFPDDERKVQAEFERNRAFALDVAESAERPETPDSHLGNVAPDFELDPFTVSHGSPQTVQVNARRRLGPVTLRYAINGGAPRGAPTREWNGGERYGESFDVYYHYLRGQVTGARPGDRVRVWFEGAGKRSPAFDYSVARDVGGQVLVLANEDYTGSSPDQPGGPRFLDEHVAALGAAQVSSDVYDVDAAGRRAPHPLGVLSHYDRVLWYTGDDIITRDRRQPSGPASDVAARVAQDVQLAVRDYLNEGGKLIYTGRNAGLGSALAYFIGEGGGAPECGVNNNNDCDPLSDDFLQYYLGAYAYFDNAGAGPNGEPFDLRGTAVPFTGQAYPLGRDGGAGDGPAAFVTTSSFLPPARFPQFAPSTASLQYQRPTGGIFEPHTGGTHLFSDRADETYKRLSRTIDLRGAPGGELSFWATYDTELDWDYVFVEAHTVGRDDWTTLPAANGVTSTDTGNSCFGGLLDPHPFVSHYITTRTDPQGNVTACEPRGTTGEWHAATGGSGGQERWQVDLSRFAGRQVEVSITYASDFVVQGLGAFLDDAVVTVGGRVVSQTSFENGLDGWRVAGPPPGSSRPRNRNDWERAGIVYDDGAAVTSEDAIYLGFGLQAVPPAPRSALVRRALGHLAAAP